jgi:hypothetical protein
MELIADTTVKKLAPKKGYLAPYIQLPYGYDSALIGKTVSIYKVEGGFFVALENKEFKPVDSDNTKKFSSVDEFKLNEFENKLQNNPELTKGSLKWNAAKGIRTPVASVRGSHDWPVYTIAA